MQSHQHYKSSVKKELFLKKWIMGLQICHSNYSKEKMMSLLERKKAIKLSADLAMASTNNNAGASWSHALITKASCDRDTGTLAKQILGHNFAYYKCCLSNNDNNATNFTKQRHYYKTRMMIFGGKSSSKKSVLRRKFCKYSNNNNNNDKVVRARSMAKRLVKKRTQILKGLIPGGEYMDEYSLVKETLDYVVSLRAQVDVMNHLANLPSSFYS